MTELSQRCGVSPRAALHLGVSEGDVRLMIPNSQEERVGGCFHLFQQAYRLLGALLVRQGALWHIRHVHGAKQVGMEFSIWPPACLSRQNSASQLFKCKEEKSRRGIHNGFRIHSSSPRSPPHACWPGMHDGELRQRSISSFLGRGQKPTST